MKYRKKPVVIEAVQWTGKNWEEINAFIPRQLWWLEDGSLVNKNNPRQAIIIKAMGKEGNIRADIGYWIIKGVAGEFYPCNPDIFKATYEQDIKKSTNGLTMKYFVLNPNKKDEYGKASRNAIKIYADIIKQENPALAIDLRQWIYDIENKMFEINKNDT